jgi:hypothetical protein
MASAVGPMMMTIFIFITWRKNHTVMAYGMKWMAGPQSYIQLKTGG